VRGTDDVTYVYDDVMYTVWCSAYSEGGACLEIDN